MAFIHGGVGGVVNHEDDRHGFALVTFRLNDGRDADLGIGEDAGNAGEDAGASR